MLKQQKYKKKKRTKKTATGRVALKSVDSFIQPELQGNLAYRKGCICA